MPAKSYANSKAETGDAKTKFAFKLDGIIYSNGPGTLGTMIVSHWLFPFMRKVFSYEWKSWMNEVIFMKRVFVDRPRNINLWGFRIKLKSISANARSKSIRVCSPSPVNKLPSSFVQSKAVRFVSVRKVQNWIEMGQTGRWEIKRRFPVAEEGSSSKIYVHVAASSWARCGALHFKPFHTSEHDLSRFVITCQWIY